MKYAKFEYDSDKEYYIPACKNGIAVTAILSNRFLRYYDIPSVRSLGYVPILTNGQEIGKVNITV